MTNPGRRWRWLLLALTLATSLWLAVTSGDDDIPQAVISANPEATRRAPRAGSASHPAAPVHIARAGLPAWPAPEPSGLAAWGPPQPPAPPAPPPAPSPAPPAPPPPPQAPPFPYELIGSLQEGSQTRALLSGAAHTLAVQAGDVIDGQWRVDKVDASKLQLTWLPGGLSQNVGYRPS